MMRSKGRFWRRLLGRVRDLKIRRLVHGGIVKSVICWLSYSLDVVTFYA